MDDFGLSMLRGDSRTAATGGGPAIRRAGIPTCRLSLRKAAAEAGAGVVPPPTKVGPMSSLILDMVKFHAPDRPSPDKLARVVGGLCS